MTRTREVSIEKALIEDAKEILELQKLAYVSEAEIIDDFTIPPLHQTIDEIISEFKRRVFLKVELDKKIRGSVRAHLEGETCHIGKLIVLSLTSSNSAQALRHFPAEVFSLDGVAFQKGYIFKLAPDRLHFLRIAEGGPAEGIRVVLSSRLVGPVEKFFGDLNRFLQDLADKSGG